MPQAQTSRFRVWERNGHINEYTQQTYNATHFYDTAVYGFSFVFKNPISYDICARCVRFGINNRPY